MRSCCTALRTTRRLLIPGLFWFALWPPDEALTQVKILSQSSSRIILEFRFPELQTFDDQSLLQAELELVAISDHLYLPARVYYLPDAADIDRLSLVSMQTGAALKKPLDSLLVRWSQRRAQFGDSSIVLAPEISLKNTNLPQEPFRLKTVGTFRGKTVQALYVFPILPKPQGLPVLLRSVTLQIDLKDSGKSRKTDAPLVKPANGIKDLFLNESSPPNRLRLARDVSKEFNQAQIKIIVNQDGLYKVTYEALQEAGAEIPPDLDTWDLRLTNKGRPVAFYIFDREDGSFDPGDYIEFYGEVNKAPRRPETPDVYFDPYSTENVYWLEWGNGKGQRMIEEEGLVLETDPSRFYRVYNFPSLVHYEYDRHYDRLGQYQQKTPRDHWFLDAGVFSSEKREYNIELPDPADQSDRPVKLKVMLHGQTYSTTRPHQVEIFLNEKLVLSGEWFGQELYSLESSPDQPISANILSPVRNSVTVVNRAPDTEIDNFFINWIEITYPRLLKAHRGYLEFTAPVDEYKGLFDFEIQGFESDQISIYKLGVSKIIGADILPVIDAEGDTTYIAHFQDEVYSDQVRYVAVEESKKLEPLKIELHEPFNLRDPSLAADYVIIVYDSLYESEALQTLAEHRREQGHRVLIVPVSVIFNQFSYGLFSPAGIKQFLKYAYETWPIPLKFVLLVGDGSYDSRNIRRLGNNLIPVYQRQMVKWGASASDHWYSLMTPGDELPDIFVGRLPVNNEDELQAVVAKIIEYESMPQKGEWLNRMLLIGGNGRIFRTQTEYLVKNVLPPRFELRRLYTYLDTRLESDPYYGGTSELIDYFDSGLFLVNFMGHGGGAIWADNSLMRIEDVSRLSNQGKYPIITSMTCFTGSFDIPHWQTLSEHMLLTPEVGSPAIWASSGLGWAREDFAIVRELFELMRIYGNQLTLGEYLAAAKINYISKNLSALGFSILNQYNLLGDPGMRLLLPDQNVDLKLAKSYYAKGDTVLISGSAAFDRGRVTVQLVNEDRQVVLSESLILENGTFTGQVSIPAELSGNEAWVRVYATDDVGRVHSSTAQKISLNSIFVDSLYTNLSTVQIGDSVQFFARIEHAFSLKIKRIVVVLPQKDSLNLERQDDLSLYVSQSRYRPLRPGEVLRYFLEVEDVEGNRYTSRIQEETLPSGPDLKLIEGHFNLIADQTIRLQLYAFNLGDVEAKNAEVRFEQWSAADQTWNLLDTAVVTIPKKDRRLIMLPVYPGTGEVTYRVTIDPENRIAESDESNNTLVKRFVVEYFPITSEYGSSLTQGRSDTIAVDPLMRFFVPPGSVDSTIILRVRRLSTIPLVNQPDFKPVVENGKPVAYEIQNMDSLSLNNRLNVSIFLTAEAISVNENVTSSNGGLQWSSVSLCRFDEFTKKWIRLPVEQDRHNLHTSVQAPGLIGLFTITDQIPPRVELMVEGQLFSEGGYVPAEPTISLTATDMNGIDVSRESIRIFLNDQLYPYEEFTFSDTAAAQNGIALTFRPNLKPGTHVLKVQIRDAAGNQNEPLESQFKVAETQQLIFLGNYPNPFKNYTVFAYELSDHAEDLELKIYTASGALIRVIKAFDVVEDPNPLGPNYHEITWDARDAYGERVANGLYYFKLRVKFKSGAQEYVGKIARLK